MDDHFNSITSNYLTTSERRLDQYLALQVLDKIEFAEKNQIKKIWDIPAIQQVVFFLSLDRDRQERALFLVECEILDRRVR